VKKYIAAVLVLVIAFTLVSCTSEKPGDLDVEKPQDNEDIIEDNNSEDEDENPQEPISENNKEEVVLYFANNEYIETGSEDLDKVLPENRIIEYNNTSLEEEIVRELMKGPELEELSTSIPETVKLLGVKVENKIAFVDFAAEGLNGGSLQEDLTIMQIVNTLLELDSVEKVQFLIDGKESESLMGHMDIMEPYDSKLE